MDPSIISALSAVLGSLVGGAASISTAWFTQRAQSRRELMNTEIKRRELVYIEFISECSKLAVDALDNTLEKPATLIQAYALQNRIRLTSSPAVIAAAESTITQIVEQYFQPALTTDQLRSQDQSSRLDPLRNFSEACRCELVKLQRET
jgi:hypothetical protein